MALPARGKRHCVPRRTRRVLRGRAKKRSFFSLSPYSMSTVNYHTSRSSNLAALNAIVLNVSTLTGSTIQTTATATTSSIVFSSMSGSTLTTSTMTGNQITISTLTVSSINNGTPGVAAYSTLNVSTLNATSTITTSTLTTTSNVGIGTATPGAPLHIYEATGTAGSVRFSHGNIGSQSIVFQSNPNSGSDYGYIQFVDSVVATGYTGFNYFNTTSATEAAALVIGCENDRALVSGPDVVVIKAGSIVLDSVISTGTGVTYITSNVGIGVTAPNAPLQFANTGVNRKIVLWEDGNNDHQYYGFGINGGILRYQGHNHVFYTATSATASFEQMRIASNGNVLLNASSAVGNGLLQITSIAGGTAQDAISCRACFDSNYIIIFYNTAAGLRGQIRGVNSSSVAYDTSSDRRLKDNIHPIEGSLSIVNQLNPVHFRWKNDDQYDFGFIAQDVYKVLPHLRPNFSNYIKDCSCQKNDLWNGIQCDHCLSMNDEPVDDEGNPKYYSLDYGKFSPYLIGAVKELVKQNADLQAIIDTQAAQIATILARLNTAGIA